VRTSTIATILLALALGASASQAEARKFTCAGGDVSCLIAAISAANASDRPNIILLSAGVYTLTTPYTGGTTGLPPDAGLPPIAGRLTIVGEAAESTIIERPSDAEAFRIFTVLGDLTLRGLTIRGGGGQSAVNGGAILAEGRLTIADCVLTGNRAREGGAIALRNAGKVLDSTIDGNEAIEGAGVLVAGAQAALEMKGSTVAGNRGTFGGGLDVQRGGTATISNSTFSGNTAFTGSAVQEGIAPDAPVDPALFPPGTATIANSTVAGNRTATFPFAGRTFDSRLGEISLKGTIVANNVSPAGDCPRTATSLGFNLIGNATDCPAFLVATDLTGEAGLGSFVDDAAPGRGYYPLVPGSQAIDAGGTAPPHKAVNATGDCPPTDQIGQPRVGRCDIGAIEFVADRVTIRQSRFDAASETLFVSATSSAVRNDVSLAVSVPGCIADQSMLRLDRSYLFLTTTSCGDIENQTVTITSTGGGSASREIR